MEMTTVAFIIASLTVLGSIVYGAIELIWESETKTKGSK